MEISRCSILLLVNPLKIWSSLDQFTTNDCAISLMTRCIPEAEVWLWLLHASQLTEEDDLVGFASDKWRETA
jgi:hypothetical protein